MAILKCKMCGDDLIVSEGQTIAECESCGVRQTVPNADNEKKVNLFTSAHKLRAACEFDRAMAVYDSIRAEFPDEAEAYWGLVLCKYGIEYVDDPATDKKVPTCHRSSYDSIIEDSDFEQTLENADNMARKVYLEEAKHLEQIRKDILAVSSKEAPYDVFICYKETDANGDRTLDSQLAQQIYMALTDRGYRVFFARVTLKGALGAAYEPIIFAALNSAKVMLAIGTSYEYFNAVWVKNEWSRYLKICAQSKDKHLIPCFRDIDAYDMPKEFRPLQAVDLGQMGAIQDIVLNMEKYIPLQKNTTTVVQEKVVVGGSGNNKIASLLDRGNMALEDGDWAKADSFFEDVLNNDSKNAQAYLGKTLVQERCRTIDAFVRKRKDATQNVRGEKLSIEPNYAHVEEMVEKYSLSGYVEQSEIRKLYTYDLSYHSDIAERKQQYRNEEAYWANHKWLSKAEKFATGSVAENIAREKKVLLVTLNDRVKQAEAAEAAAKQDVQARYEAHLCQADEQAEERYSDCLKRREADYMSLVQTAKMSCNIAELNEITKKLEKLGDYQDSKNFVEHCRNRVAEEQAKIQAEAERQRILKEKEEKERKDKAKRNTILIACVSGVVLLALLFVYILNTVIIPNNHYNDALEQMEAGNYESAIEMFAALEDYKDSSIKIRECQTAINEGIYMEALALMDSQQYKQAYALFESILEYRDSEAQATEALYQEGLQYWNEKEYEESNAIFTKLGGYKDSEKLIHKHVFESAVELEPLCEKEGITRYNCMNCAHSYTEPIAATGHTFSEEIAVEPGCETEGILMQICICGHKEEEPISATGHSYDNGRVTTIATCTAEGVMSYTCHCGTSFTESIEKTEHTYEEKITTVATCKNQGVVTITCTGCGMSYTESISKTAHDYQSVITTAASCETAGVRTYTCKGCGDSYTEKINALGHEYSQATCTAGSVCTNCQHMQQEALGHTTDYGMCDRCGKTFAPTLVFTGDASNGKECSHLYSLPKGRYKLTLTISEEYYNFKVGMDGPGMLFLTGIDGPGTYTQEIKLNSGYTDGDIVIRGAGSYTLTITPI